MHPLISHILANPHLRGAMERGLAARGVHGDHILAHINAQEAAMLKARGGVGTANPHTGLPQFWEDGGGAGNSAGSGSSHQGDGGNGMGGGGNSSGNGGSNQGSGGYTGTHASGPGFGSGPANSPSGGFGQYGSNGGYNGGVTINSGKLGVKLAGALLGPIGMAISSGYGLLGPDFGPSLNIGGTTNGYAIDGSKTGVYSLGGGSGTGHMGAPGQNGEGQRPGGPGGIMGNGGTGAPATLPGGAPGAGGLPPGSTIPGASGGPLMGGNNQALLALMSQASPNLFGNRFGPMPTWATQPYQIGTIPAVNQPPRIPGTPFA